jgi:ligand-binding sensor domain-containing protein
MKKKDEVFSILQDSLPIEIQKIYQENNNVWVGTNGKGFWHYNIVKNEIKQVKKVPCEVVKDIQYDEQKGLFWLATSYGVLAITARPIVCIIILTE